MTTFKSALINFIIISFCSFNASAEPVKTAHTEIELASEATSISPGQAFWVGLYFKLENGWHTYWKNPGDSGQPVTVQWRLPVGFTIQPIEWPHPHHIPIGTFVNFGYENEVLLLAQVTPPKELDPGQLINLAAKVNWLVCKDICVPEEAQVTLFLPINKSATASHPYWREIFSAARADLPGKLSNWDLRAEGTKESSTLFLKPKFHYTGNLEGLFFFPEQEGLIENAEPQVLTFADGQYQLVFKNVSSSPAPLKALQGVLISPRGWGSNNTKKAVQVNLPVKAVMKK